MTRIQGVILPDAGDGWYGPGTEGWAPSDEDLRAAEPAVLACIREAAPDIFARLDEYRCQYIGVIVAGGRRIYYNFVHCDADEIDEDWPTEPVCVLDGGDDYFHLEYDLAARACLRFYVNGEA